MEKIVLYYQLIAFFSRLSDFVANEKYSIMGLQTRPNYVKYFSNYSRSTYAYILVHFFWAVRIKRAKNRLRKIITSINVVSDDN